MGLYLKNCLSQVGLFLNGSGVVVASSAWMVGDKYIASFVIRKIQFDVRVPESQKHFALL